MERLREKLHISESAWRVLEVVAYALIAGLVAYLIITFVGQRTVVDGDSMYPGLENKDNIIVEKLSYRFGKVKRYDVIVFNYHDPVKNEDSYYIKRVIGLPGETIVIIDGLVYLIDEDGNEVYLNEDYGYYTNAQVMEAYMASVPMKIPEDQYFVLGDNRNRSYDSRQIGLVKNMISAQLSVWLNWFYDNNIQTQNIGLDLFCLIK